MATKSKTTSTYKSKSKNTKAKTAAKNSSSQTKSASKKNTTKKSTSTAKKTPTNKNTAQKGSTKTKSTAKSAPSQKTSSTAKTSAPKSTSKQTAPAPKSTASKMKNIKQKRQKLFDQLHKMLLDERKQLLQKALKTQNIKESTMHGDIVDQSNDYLDRELLMGLAEHDRFRLQEIDEAIQRMDEGTYGICQMSGEEISDERLLAMPTAKYTLECQSKLEGR